MNIDARTRARGAIAGLGIGDAIGRPVEGLSAALIQEQYGRLVLTLTGGAITGHLPTEQAA